MENPFCVCGFRSGTWCVDSEISPEFECRLKDISFFSEVTIGCVGEEESRVEFLEFCDALFSAEGFFAFELGFCMFREVECFNGHVFNAPLYLFPYPGFFMEGECVRTGG